MVSLRHLGFWIESLSGRFFFLSQKRRKSCTMLERVDLPLYFASDIFRKTVSDAIELIGQKDRDALVDVRRYLRAFVEVSPKLNSFSPINMGFSTGVYYAKAVPSSDSDLAVKSIACSIVQFVTSYRLIEKARIRCPKRYKSDLVRKIKRIAIQRMHRFTVIAGFDGCYSYEIECKLKNGAYGC